MSIFKASDYGNKKERPKKTKLPTESKTVLTTCPFCSHSKSWSEKLKKCEKCGVSYQPDKLYTMRRATDLL